MTIFDAVADEYDAARPAYPDGVYDALESLEGVRVAELGSGTGVATRQLLARGAAVVAVDAGSVVLARAAKRSPGLAAVVADGARLPMRDASVDLVCCAQSWHWLDPATRGRETHRVLDEGGRWAAWWTQTRADGEAWFDDYCAVVEAATGGAVRREQRDTDWGATIAADGLFDVGDRIDVPWVRVVPIDVWLTDVSTHSWVVAMDPPVRATLFDRLRAILNDAFPDGHVRAPHETWLWIARKN